MTIRGIGYLGLLALTLFLAFATGIREIFWIVLFLTLLLALAAVSVLLASFCITCRQQLLTKSIKRLDDVSLEVTLSGFLLFPALVDFGIMAPKSAQHKHVRFSTRHAVMTRLSLPLGLFRESFSMEIACDHRGVWKTIPHRIRVYDAFGIFSLPLLRPGAVSEPTEQLAVYPQMHPLDMDVDAPQFTTDSSSLLVSVADYGDSFAGVRAYRPGDSMKRIHWVQTVRTRELQTRQYEISAEPYILLLLDTGIHSGRVDDYADIATECAATLAQHYVGSGQCVRLMVMGNEEKDQEDWDVPVVSEDDFYDAYDRLVMAQFAKVEGALDMTRIRVDNAGQLQAAYVITDRYSDELFSALNDLATHRCETSYIMPQPENKEEDLPDLEGTMIHMIATPKPEEIADRLKGGLKR